MTDTTAANFDFGTKKKKKKPTAATTSTAASTKKEDKPEEVEIEKAEQTTAATVNTDEKGQQQQQEDQASSPAQAPTPSEEKKQVSSSEEFKPTGQDYTYEELAKRIFNLINSSRPEEKTVYKMKPPVVYREGTSRTVWVNFAEICKIMDRQQDHVLSFVLAEVGSTGSIDGNQRLVIRGRFQPKHIENILRNYIGEYVKCHTCKSPETHLKKENRLTFMVCEKCGSSRSVTAIKTGFVATTRAQRRTERQQ